jgi:uncharacterized protein (DUF433 family)
MARQHVNYTDRIVKDPEVMAGKPVVKGTRIPVERVIRHLADNPDINDLFEAFPHLTMEDVKACLAYAHDRLDRGDRPEARQARAAGRAGK